jgi:hypothetical protein
MKVLAVDSSAIISLSTNCLLWTLNKLKEITGVHLVIPERVRYETVDKAIDTPRFKLEGTRVMRNIANRTFEVVKDDALMTAGQQICDIANQCYSTNSGPIKIMHPGDGEVITLAKRAEGGGLITDERIMRTFLEDPEALRNILSSRLHTRVEFNQKAYKEVMHGLPELFVLRSADIIAIAYKKGVFDDFLRPISEPETKRAFVSGMMWGLKLSGCSLSNEEVEDYIRILG